MAKRMRGRGVAGRGVAALGVLVLCTGCLGTEPGAPRAIDDRFFVVDVGWDTGATLAVYLGLAPVQGQVAICSAYRVRNDSAVSSTFNPILVDAVVVRLGDRLLVQGLGFPPELAPGGRDDRAYLGREAACRLTGVTWAAGDEALLPTVTVPQLQVGDNRNRIRARSGRVQPTRL